jgi:hypothetical protein
MDTAVEGTGIARSSLCVWQAHAPVKHKAGQTHSWGGRCPAPQPARDTMGQWRLQGKCPEQRGSSLLSHRWRGTAGTGRSSWSHSLMTKAAKQHHPHTQPALARKHVVRRYPAHFTHVALCGAHDMARSSFVHSAPFEVRDCMTPPPLGWGPVFVGTAHRTVCCPTRSQGSQLSRFAGPPLPGTWMTSPTFRLQVKHAGQV